MAAKQKSQRKMVQPLWGASLEAIGEEMKGDVFHEELPDGRIRTSTASCMTVSKDSPHGQGKERKNRKVQRLRSEILALRQEIERLQNPLITITSPTTQKYARQTTANDYWVTQPDGSRKLIIVAQSGKKVNANDQILREILEEVITKSHRQWRSIPETTFLVLKAIEDYQSGN